MPHRSSIARFLTLACAGAALAACNSSEETVDETAVEPMPELTQSPVATAAPDGTALEAGSWNVGESADGASAVFAQANGEPRLAFMCDTRTGEITMNVAGAADAAQDWRVDAGGEAASVSLQPNESGQLAGEIEPTLALFHAFAAPQQTVALTSPDGARSQYPTHPGIKRVLDACS